MRKRDIRICMIHVLLMVLWTVAGSPGVLLAASSNEGHQKRHGPIEPLQPKGQPDPDLLPLWAALLGKASGPVWVEWSHLWGTPQAVYGTLTTPIDVSETSARRFLSSHAALLKLDQSLPGLSLTRTVATLGGTLYRFSQSADDVPVYGAEVTVRFDKQGRVVALTNTAVPSATLVALPPTVKDADAVNAARGAVPSRPKDDEPTDDLPGPSTRLVIYAESGTPTLAWEVVVHTHGPTWQVFVHAQKGTVVTPARDLNRYVNGTGKVFKVNAIVATGINTLTDQGDSAAAVPAGAYSTVTLPGLDGSGYLDGIYASSSDTKKRVSSPSNTFLYDRSSNGFSETMGYYYLDFAQGYLQLLGFTNVNNRQQVFSIDRYKKDDSFYDTRVKTISYGLGGVDDAEDADVILHEYGHAILDDQVPGFGPSGEADAIGEGFGDYWAGTVGEQNWPTKGPRSACLASWDASSYDTHIPPCLRRLDSTKQYPQDLVGDPHDDGEIWSAVLWQIHGALGGVTADKVIIEHHFLLSANTSFNAAANALMRAASDLGLKNSEINAIRTILQDRGFTVTL
ncbi:MAG TPA: M36 family metallopeptidase [Nitrospira sp.]|nr:M36 family metallopeptidase [Nitrospira sp.]